jgi:hypothetical protein
LVLVLRPLVVTLDASDACTRRPATIRASPGCEALDGLTPLALALSGFPRAVFLGAIAVLVRRTRIAPRWIGWTGAALVLVSLASTATLVIPALFPVTALAALLFVAWVAALSVALLRRSPTGTAA